MLSVDDVLEILSIRLLGVIPDDELIIVSANRGMPLTLDDNKSPAGEAFRDIARRIAGEQVPMRDLYGVVRWGHTAAAGPPVRIVRLAVLDGGD